MFDDKKQNLNDLVAPAPITRWDEGCLVTFKKGTATILKLNTEDYKSLYEVKILLDTLLRNNVVTGELEQLRDLVTEITGS